MPVITPGRLSQKKKDNPNNFYPTEPALALAQCRLVKENFSDSIPHPSRLRIVDMGAGLGIYGRAAREMWPLSFIYGIDIQPQPVDTATYDYQLQADLSKPLIDDVDIAIGNPPYDRTLTEKILRQVWLGMRPGGIMCVLTRSGYLYGRKRASGFYQDHKVIGEFKIPERPSFSGDGKTDADEYVVIVMQKGAISHSPFWLTSYLWYEQGYSIGVPPEGVNVKRRKERGAKPSRVPSVEASEGERADESVSSQVTYQQPSLLPEPTLERVGQLEEPGIDNESGQGQLRDHNGGYVPVSGLRLDLSCGYNPLLERDE